MCINNCNNCNGCNPCNQQNPCGCKTSTDDIVYNGPELSCTGIETCDTLTDIITNLSEYLCSVELVQVIINNITNNVNLYNQFTTIVNNSVDCETVIDCIPTTTSTTTVLGELLIQNQTLDSVILSMSVESGVFLSTNVFPVLAGQSSTGTHGITTAALFVDLEINGDKKLILEINSIPVETLTYVTTGIAVFSPVVIYPTDNVTIKLQNI